jgi:hypothetical protein
MVVIRAVSNKYERDELFMATVEHWMEAGVPVMLLAAQKMMPARAYAVLFHWVLLPGAVHFGKCIGAIYHGASSIIDWLFS